MLHPGAIPDLLSEPETGRVGMSRAGLASGSSVDVTFATSKVGDSGDDNPDEATENTATLQCFGASQ